MTDRERAIEYIRIFINVGGHWRNYVPLDSVATETGLRIGTVLVGPGDNGTWWLTEGYKTTWFRKAVSS